jgi:ATP-dependent Lhr-like helicase
VAQSLLWDFINVHMYEWDAPRAEQQLQMLAVNRDLLQDLLTDVALDELLRPEAIESVRDRLQHTASTARARTAEELAVLLQEMGDLSSPEIARRSTVDPSDWIARLTGENRLVELAIPGAHGPEHRWVAAEYQPEYAAAFDLGEGDVPTIDPAEARRRILGRFLEGAGPVTLEDIRARYAFPEDWLQGELDRLIEARQLLHGRFTPEPERTGSATPSVAEYVDRRALEQIHRRTLYILRREVQPVPFAVYADFLARLQHLHPRERLSGEGALTRVLQQLRAAPVVGQVWERDVLPLRLDPYRPAELSALCQGGEVVWVGSGGTDPRRGRVRFLFRGEGHVYLEPAPRDSAALGEQARTVYAFLKSEGAVFFADICSALELETPVAEAALVELVMAGLATNDSLEAMRVMVEGGSPRPRERKPLSSLESELARRREQLGLRARRKTRKPGPAQYRAAKRHVRQRLEQPEPRLVGRWTPVHRFGVLGKAVPVAERVSQQTRQLLARHGVVTRECLADESGSWDWSLIYQHLRRMEMRGEVRRGYFVEGLPGVQFALPDAIERLRAIRDEQHEPEPVVMNACDPANLYGPARENGPQVTGGELLSFARVPSTWMVQHRGLPILVAGSGGASVTVPRGVEEGLLQRALGALLDHLANFVYRVAVETWNGEPVLKGTARPLLEAAGFYRSYPEMVWERRP